MFGPLVRLLTYLRSRLATDDRGAGIIEYAMVVALVSVVAIGAVIVIGDVTSSSVSNVSSNFP